MTRYSNPLPERIVRLEELAVDLWWVWHQEARELFRRLDYRLWRGVCHACVMMSRLLPAADRQIGDIADFLRRRLAS